MIIVGSRALGWRTHQNRDYDLIGSPEEIFEITEILSMGKDINIIGGQKSKYGGALFLNTGDVIEFEDTSLRPSSKAIHDYVMSCVETREGLNKILVESGYDPIEIPTVDVFGFQVVAVSPQVVHMMKASHRYLRNSKHFQKTMDDIHRLRSEGHFFQGNYALMSILKQREEETYWYKHPNLNTTKGEFFTDDVPYIYDHDTIHEAVALGERPAYTYYMEDGAQVKCSKEKFWELSQLDRLRGVLEEAYVLALERAIIPNDAPVEEAFRYALEKVCTSITSGWFREFAWENYYDVLALHEEVSEPCHFVEAFNYALEDGLIKPYKEAV